MGKRQIGEMEPFELVITLIIADLATIPMAEQTIPLWYGVIPLLVITVIHFVASILTKKSPLMRDIISGKPVIVIDPNGIDFKELKNLNISCEELLEALRNLDYFDLTDINYAIIERTGKITVIPKTGAMPATRKDLQLVKPETDVFYCIIENGRVIKKNFAEMGLHLDVTDEILRTMQCHTRDIAFCALSAGGDVYIQKFGAPARNFKIKITYDNFARESLIEKSHNNEQISTATQQKYANNGALNSASMRPKSRRSK
jgi:uncharacterized membrane protein YcaP (DUF421 family)